MIPVIFIHRGSGEQYLEYVLRQAKEYNENIILLGDDKNNIYNFIKHVPYKNYCFHSNAFEKVYTPMSTLGDYETFCFQRWFILYEYMKTENIDKCFYLDSDIMFYGNAEEEAEKFKQFDLTLIHKSVGNSSYITYNGLKDFCKFTYELYKNRGYEFDKIASHYHVMQKYGRPGGVCDMTLFEYYARYKNPAGVGEMMYEIDNTVYDHCINQVDRNYEMKNGIKNIQFTLNRPFCKKLTTNKDIRFVTLHFQGGCKGLIPQFYRRKWQGPSSHHLSNIHTGDKLYT